MYKYESEKNACDKIHNPNVIYFFKVNNENNSKRCVICLKLTMMTPERCQWHRSDVFGNYEQVNPSWEYLDITIKLYCYNFKLLQLSSL